MDGPIRVLLVDDDPSLAELVADFLSRTDDRFEVDTATGASEGCSRLDESEFDCVVSDYDMPGTDGIEFLEAVREECQNLPFILYTGKGSEEVASDAIAAGVTDYLQKGSDPSHYELLANRIGNAVEQSRSTQRARKFDRLHDLIKDVNQALVRAESRSAAEDRICEVISDSESYLFAWIGGPAADGDRIEPRASAGIEAGYLDDVTITADESPTGRGPSGTAIRENRVVTSHDLEADPAFEPWRGEAIERGYRSSAAVPLEYDEALYGLLCVYADESGAFDETERELLAELGDTIAHAFYSMETRQELREERALVEQGLQTLPDVFYVVEPDGTLVRWNDRLSAVTGYSDAELDDMRATDLFPADERRRVADAIDDALDDGDAVVEAELSTGDGDRVPYEFTGSRLTDSDGELIGVIGIGRDISERKERNRRLETLIDNLPGMVYRCRNESGWPMENVRGEVGDLTGYSASDLEQIDGLYGHQIIHPDDRQSVWDAVQDAIEAGDPFELTYRIRTADETIKWVWERGRAIFSDDGELLALEGFITDITERKHREQMLERQNERLDTFTSVVGHDLRNPLNVASGRLELAREECTSEHVPEAINAIDRSLTLVEDLLTLARTPDRVDEFDAVDLAETVEECWRTVETADATLVVETDRTVRADEPRLKQLLENAIRNAVEHGGDDVRIMAGDTDDGAGFFVADDGSGVPEADRERIFEPGYSTGEGGTGYGLDIVRDIADAHGWSVSVTESARGGARFEFTGVDGS